MHELEWNGVTSEVGLSREAAATRHAVADAAKAGQWDVLLSLLHGSPELVNSCRPGGSSLFAPLHQAGYNGAPTHIIDALLDLGAWRTLPNAAGERPVDVASRRGHGHLLVVLAPVLHRSVPLHLLRDIEQHFHNLIRSRVADLVDEYRLRLPLLVPLLEFTPPRVWFPVPGMYGGFQHELTDAGDSPALSVSSWSRISGGSGQRHVVTAAGAELVEEGFV